MVGNIRSSDELREIRKALSANSGITDIAALYGGGALSMQFLDTTMASMVATNKDFRFLNAMPKRGVDEVIAEYTQYKNHGDNFYSDSYVQQSSDPRYGDAALKRQYDQMTYLAEGFQFAKVLKQVRNIQDPETVQANSALMRVLISLSRTIWYGDSTTSPYQSTGFVKKLTTLGGFHVFDCRGVLPSTNQVKQLVAQLYIDKFAVANQFWMPVGTKNLFDNYFVNSNQQTVFQNQSQNPGNVAQGNITPFIYADEAYDGKVNLLSDRWLDKHNQGVPMVYNPATDSYAEGATDVLAPNAPTLAVAAVAPVVPNSLWDLSWNGKTIRYRVAAKNSKGASIASAISSAVIATNGAMQLTITPAGGGQVADSFLIFRETNDGTGVYKLIDIVQKAVTPTTVYVDLNLYLPGYGVGVLGDFNSRSDSDETRTFMLSELLAPLKTVFPLGIGGQRVYTGMVEYYVVPQIFVPEKFVLFINLPVS
jgi:hypothetical protein